MVATSSVIDWTPDGVVVRSTFPEQEAEPARVEMRVFTDSAALQAYLNELWLDNVQKA